MPPENIVQTSQAMPVAFYHPQQSAGSPRTYPPGRTLVSLDLSAIGAGQACALHFPGWKSNAINQGNVVDLTRIVGAGKH